MVVNSCRILQHETQPPISSWDEFKNLLRDQFYPLGYHNNQLIK